jgi:tetratricopeptide (TPR) repeat protein
MKLTWIKSLAMMWELMFPLPLLAQTAPTAPLTEPADSLLAEARTAMDNFEEAIGLSTPSDSLMARLYGGLADCYGIPSHWPERIEAFKMRYQYGRQEITLYAIASLYEQMNHPTEALTYYEKFIAELDRSQSHVQNPDAAQRTKLASLYADTVIRIKKLKAEAFFRDGKKE